MVSTQILKQLRAQHGWTQEQLATISGVSSRTIQRIEQTGDCSLESKMAIAAAFNITPQYITEASEATVDPELSPLSNFAGWGIFIAFIFAVLWLQGGGIIEARLHINAITLLVTLTALSLRTMEFKQLIHLASFSFGLNKSIKHLNARLAIVRLNQLIRFTYISAMFAFVFHVWLMSMSFSFSSESPYSAHFMNIIVGSAIASLLYGIFVAEFLIRTSKLKLEQQILMENQLKVTDESPLNQVNV